MIDKPREYTINDIEDNIFDSETPIGEYSNDLNEINEAAPPLLKYTNTSCECLELDKLLLNNSCFNYKSSKNDFYKITIGENIEINYKILKKNIKNIDNKYINIYHYNFANLLDYAKNVIRELKNKNKKKINFELKLIFQKNQNKEKNNEKNITNDIYNLNISCKYIFLYLDNYENYSIKKTFEHKNIFEDILMTAKILNEIEQILIKIKLKNEEEKRVNIKVDKKINKINGKKFNIIYFKKMIFKHNNSVQMIKELACGKYVSCGIDGLLILYDENFNKISEVKIIENWIYSISEIPDTKNEFMVCCPEKIFLVTIKDNTLDVESKILKIKESLNLYAFPTREDEIILCGNKTLNQYNTIIKDLKNEIKNNNIYVLNNLHTTSGKRITENIIVVVSNNILNNGENILKFINTKNKNEFGEEKYSFNINPNSLLIIDTDIPIQYNNSEELKRKNRKKKKGKKEIIQNNLKHEKNKLLFCACTKYKTEEKNGILILCPNGIKIENNFYDTGEFEVFCFCLLNNNNNENRNYIFVGGYDNNLKRGLIKLYEILYDEDMKIENTKLKFKKNIENLNKILEPINCIIQSSKTGEIVVTCWDGTLNLFSKPSFLVY